MANDSSNTSNTPAVTDPSATSGFSGLSGTYTPSVGDPTPAPAAAATPTPAPAAPVAQNPATTPAPAPSPAPAPGAKWENILQGALMGMVGGAGQKFFGTGMAAGGATVLNNDQRQTENQQRQQQIDQQQAQVDMEKQEEPARIQFVNAQAASMAADASIKAHQAANWDADHARAVEADNRNTADWFMSHGFNPVAATANDGKSEMAAMKGLGTVPPTTTLQVAPNSLLHFDLSTMPQQVGLDYVNKQNVQLGKGQIDPQVWAQMPQAARIQMVYQATQYWNPQVSENTLLQYQNDRARVAAIPDAQLPDKAATLAHYDRLISGMQATLDQAQKRDIDQRNKLTAGTAGADAAAAGQKAYATAYNSEKGRDDALVSMPGTAGSGEGTGPTSGTGVNLKYLNSLPTPIANNLQAVAQGRVPITARMFTSKNGQKFGQMLTMAYPGFDATKTAAYSKMRTDFTSGKTSVGINSYNTAIAHLGTMWDHVEKANDISINTPGMTAHRQLAVDLQLVSTELAKAVSNGQMTESEKDGILKSITGHTTNSYKTRIKEAITLLSGKLEAYRNQWHNGMPQGFTPPFSIISPESQSTINRIVGSGQPQQNNTPSAVPQGATMKVPGSDGKMHWSDGKHDLGVAE